MLRRVATLLVISALAGCSDPTAPDAGAKPLLDASVAIDHVTTDLTGLMVVNACTAEIITVDGQLTTRTQSVTTASGGTTVTVYQKARASGTSDLGARYQLILVTHATVIDVLSSDASVLAVPFTLKFVGEGPGNNFYIRSLVHITTNAFGETTSHIDRTEVGCQ